MRHLIARAALAVLVLATALPVNRARASTNLVFNGDFEMSRTDEIDQTTNALLLPINWVFEGAAGGFGYVQSSGSHGGRRMVSISTPASGKPTECVQSQCVTGPLNPVKDTSAQYYSITPFWCTFTAANVVVGRSYALSVWVSYKGATAGVGGVLTRIRWTEIYEVPIAESVGPKKIASAGAPDIGWTQLSTGTHPFVAPPGAKGAIVMVGAADDVSSAQMFFDDVDFHQI